VNDLGQRLRAWWGLRRTRRVKVDGHTLQVPPGVLDPVLFRAGAWFAQEVKAAAAAQPGLRVLDMGCGTGVVGVLAQAARAEVVASDLDPTACSAARENGLGDVRRGDLFEALPDERFDLVAFNPPYLIGQPGQHPLGRALYGGEDLSVVRRFAQQVDAHLRPGGRAWVVLSDRAHGAAAALGAGWTRDRQTVIRGETLALWARPGPSG
jgi:methylase of polypeptide subunit release factors